MTKKELFEEAHEITRNIVKETGVNYRVQFGICLSFLYQIKKEVEKEVEFKGLTVGSPKQIAWAEKIREGLLEEAKKYAELEIILSDTAEEVEEAMATYKAFVNLANTNDARFIINNLKNRDYIFIIENLL